MKKIFAATITVVGLALGAGQALAMGSSSTPAAAPSSDDSYEKAVKAVEAKEYREAISLLNKVIEAKPRNPDALNYLGFSHRKLGDYSKAVSYYQRALALEPEHKGANEYLGEAYVELGNMSGAMERLATLEKACGTDCEEYRTLKAAIEAARAKSGTQG